MKIKVCGITQVEQALQLSHACADFLGFIFYPKSARYVIGKLSSTSLSTIPKSIKKVGVFVNESPHEIVNIVKEYALDMVQLHGNEPVEECRFLQQHIPVIKAFNVYANSNVLEVVEPYRDACDYFLFDTGGVLPGGNGEKFDWKMLTNLTFEKPYFLSGGIAPEDISFIKTFAEGTANKPFAIDINSRFELSPGIKQIEKVTQFIEQIKND